LPQNIEEIGPEDLIIITADYDENLIYLGSEHTCDFVPVLLYKPPLKEVEVSDE